MTEKTRTHWAFFDPCGCPRGVLEATPDMTKADAFEDMWEDDPVGMTRAVRSGVTAELMDHERYVRDVMPQMLPSYVCPHGAGAA